MGNKKEPQKFVSESYIRSNKWAIAKFSRYLLNNGYDVIRKKSEDFELDIKAIKNGVTEYFECETKTDYKFTCMEDFKFPTVSFLARKGKWKDVGFWYVIICRETLAFAKCHSDDVFKEEYLEEIEIDSKERQGRDRFYRVPKKKCEWSFL